MINPILTGILIGIAWSGVILLWEWARRAERRVEERLDLVDATLAAHQAVIDNRHQIARDLRERHETVATDLRRADNALAARLDAVEKWRRT